jgi:hypothetical protein
MAEEERNLTSKKKKKKKKKGAMRCKGDGEKSPDKAFGVF